MNFAHFFKEKNFTSLLKIIPEGPQTKEMVTEHPQEKMQYHTVQTEEELDACLKL